jgi:hypothetical protein
MIKLAFPWKPGCNVETLYTSCLDLGALQLYFSIVVIIATDGTFSLSKTTLFELLHARYLVNKYLKNL